jgi:hypothetical protein
LANLDHLAHWTIPGQTFLVHLPRAWWLSVQISTFMLCTKQIVPQ